MTMRTMGPAFLRLWKHGTGGLSDGKSVPETNLFPMWNIDL